MSVRQSPENISLLERIYQQDRIPETKDIFGMFLPSNMLIGVVLRVGVLHIVSS